jgi:hypothetical protein
MGTPWGAHVSGFHWTRLRQPASLEAADRDRDLLAVLAKRQKWLQEVLCPAPISRSGVCPIGWNGS